MDINILKWTRIELWSTIPENIRITGKLVEKIKIILKEVLLKKLIKSILIM